MTKNDHKLCVASILTQSVILKLPVVFKSFSLVSHVENAKSNRIYKIELIDEVK